jgi:mono/diheme cytochrome c family protein
LLCTPESETTKEIDMRRELTKIIVGSLYRFAAALVGWMALALAIGMATPAASDRPMPVAQSDSLPAPPTRPSSGPTTLIEVYRTVCLKCHERDGRGKTIRKIMPEIPDFTDPKWQDSRSDAELHHSILEGKGKKMLPMKDHLGSVDVKRMAAFIREFRGGQKEIPDDPGTRPGAVRETHDRPLSYPGLEVLAPVAVVTLSPPGSTRDGTTPEHIYKSVCQACHDVDGKGGVVRKLMPEIPDFTDSRWHRGRTDADLIHSVTKGKGQLMLPMADKLSEARITPEEMIAFVRAFNPTATTSESPPRRETQPISAIPPATNPAPTAVAAASTPSAPVAAASVKVPDHPATSTVRAAEMQAGSAFFQANCITCHGRDGRGTTVRAAMPSLPDFTRKQWHAERSNPQLKFSILDGKGSFMPSWRGKVSAELTQSLVYYVRGFGPAGLTATGNPPDDFEKSFDALQKEMDALQRQMKSLSRR